MTPFTARRTARASVHKAFPGTDGAAVVEMGQLLLHVPPGQKF